MTSKVYSENDRLNNNTTNFQDEDIDFLIWPGCLYIYCVYGLASRGLLWLIPCAPYDYMKSQRLTLEDRHIHHRYTICCNKFDNLLPYDTIQDVNINETCFHRCFGIADVSVQTAGETDRLILAPINPKLLRDKLIERRDRVVHHETATVISEDEVEIKDSFLRIEKIIERSIEILEKI